MTQVWVNQQHMASVNPFDRGLAYGDGLFATMRTYSSTSTKAGIMLLDLHLTRLEQGSKRLNLNWSASSQLRKHLIYLASSYPNACVKLLLTRGVGGRGYQAPEIANITEITSVHEIPEHYKTWQKSGVALTTSPVTLARQPLLAGIKHLNRLEQVLIKSHTLPTGFDDWLVYDTQGYLIEASMANIFIVKDNQVFTPAINQAGVSGAMREAVIDIMLARGVAVHATQLNSNSVLMADAIMMSNSLLGLIDVVRVDKNSYQPWSHTQAIAQQLQTLLS